MRLIVAALLVGSAWAQIPDTPQPQQHVSVVCIKDDNDPRWSCPDLLPETVPVQKVHYFSVRRATDAPLRTNRQTLLSPGFYLPEMAAFAATTADVVAHRNDPRAPHGRDMYVDAYVPFAACTVLSYAMDRLIWRPSANAIAGYFIVRHVRGVFGKYP